MVHTYGGTVVDRLMAERNPVVHPMPSDLVAVMEVYGREAGYIDSVAEDIRDAHCAYRDRNLLLDRCPTMDRP